MSDASVFSLLYGLTHKNQFFDWLLIFFAKYLIFNWIIILLGAFLLILFLERDWRRRFYFSSITIISVILSRGIITESIRYLYYRPRPFETLGIEPLISHAATASFPSGHMTFIIPIALVFFLMRRRLGVWFLLGSVLIGLARVAVGVHWPSDILGGILIGAASFFATYYLLKLKGVTLNARTSHQS